MDAPGPVHMRIKVILIYVPGIMNSIILSLVFSALAFMTTASAL
jgi:hypothetical protein